MERFSQAYAKVINVLQNQKFSKDFDELLQTTNIKALFDANGPSEAYSEALKKLEMKLKKIHGEGDLLA